MRDELERKLMERFSFMEGKTSYNKKESRVPVYCEFGDGWFDLVYELCKEIENTYKEKQKELDEFTVLQVKSKFGGLRFYTAGQIEGIQEIIDKYEEKSYSICEECGEKGKVLNNKGQLYTLCTKCKEGLMKQSE